MEERICETDDHRHGRIQTIKQYATTDNKEKEMKSDDEVWLITVLETASVEFGVKGRGSDRRCDVCSFVLLECRCEASREAAQIAAEIFDEAVAVPYLTTLTVFARRHGPLEGRMQLFCTTADRQAGRSLEQRNDYVKVATLHDVEVCF